MSNADAAEDYHLRPLDYYFAEKPTRDLVAAASAGDREMAARAVAAGADPNAEGPQTMGEAARLRPLHYAIARKDRTALEILLELGADPDETAQFNGNAYEFAMILDARELLSVLLEKVPNSPASAEARRRAFFAAFIYQRQRCAELLLQHGVSVDALDGIGRTALFGALNGTDPGQAIWLLDRGASPDVEAKSGLTPSYALQYNLEREREGTATHATLLKIKRMMEERGVVFPVPSPKQNRAARGR